MKGLELRAAQNAGGVKNPGIEDGWFGNRRCMKQGNSHAMQSNTSKASRLYRITLGSLKIHTHFPHIGKSRDTADVSLLYHSFSGVKWS